VVIPELEPLRAAMYVAMDNAAGDVGPVTATLNPDGPLWKMFVVLGRIAFYETALIANGTRHHRLLAERWLDRHGFTLAQIEACLAAAEDDA
jgi:hypothetical protein